MEGACPDTRRDEVRSDAEVFEDGNALKSACDDESERGADIVERASERERRRATREEQLVGWSGGALWNPPKAQALAAGLASGGYLPTLTLAQPRHPHTYLPTFLGYLTQAM